MKGTQMQNTAKLQCRKSTLDDFSLARRSHTAELPNPEITIQRLAVSVLEILSGVRELEQVIRWTTTQVYNHLQKRVVLARRARVAKKQPIVQQHYTIASIRWNEVDDGVVEASVVIKSVTRARAISMRIEGINGIWKATAFHVL